MRRWRQAHARDSHLAAPKSPSQGPLTPSRASAGRSSGGSTLARTAAVVLVIAAVAVVAVLLFRGGAGGYEVSATFDNAGQLVNGNQVEVGGRPIGTVTDIALTDDGRARVKMKLTEFKPLHAGTRATIRSNSLSGIANRYIALELGASNAPEIKDGGEIEADNATAPVDLDQLFNTLDAPTRKGLQQFVQGSAAQIDGKSKQGADSLKYLNPALSTTSQLVNEIIADKVTFERFVRDTSQVVNAVAERRNDLSALVGNANATTRAIGDENAALGHSLDVLPDTLRTANTTFVNLRSTLDDLDVLVAESKPATKDLARFFRALRPFVRDAQPTVRDLRNLIRTPGPDNDLIELTAKAPRLQRLSSTVFPRAVKALAQAQPVLEYVRPYAPDLVGWFRDFGQTTANYDANGHYARIQPIFNAFQQTDTPGGPVLVATRPSQRLEGLQFGTNQRCPGGSIQPAPDGGNPWKGTPAEGNFDCDPTTVPPGP
jgi:phospholipid/cholesterol/gamma-HCH transport system substrate-binding protein